MYATATAPGEIDPVSIHLSVLQEKRLERQRQAEAARRAAEEAARLAALPPAEFDENCCRGGEELETSEAAPVGGHLSALVTAVKAKTHGSQFSIPTLVYLGGNCQKIGMLDPLANPDEADWSTGTAAEEKEEGAHVRPWRHLFDPSGQVARYGKGRDSHLTLNGTMMDVAVNNFSFPVGVFVTSKVSRAVEYPGFESKIKQIQKSFVNWQRKNNPGNNSRLSFVGLLTPKSNATYEEEIIYKALETQDKTPEELERARMWVGRTYEEFVSGIINPNIETSVGEKLVYLSLEGPMINFIDANWTKLLKGSSYGGNTANTPMELTLRAVDVYPEGKIPVGMENNTTVVVRMVPRAIVDRAIKWFTSSQEKLPFEIFENNRIYLAKMTGQSWHDEETNSAETGYVSVKFTNYYTVCSAAQQC